MDFAHHLPMVNCCKEAYFAESHCVHMCSSCIQAMGMSQWCHSGGSCFRSAASNLIIGQWLLLAALQRQALPQRHQCDMPAAKVQLLHMCPKWDAAERACMRQLAILLEEHRY